MKKIQNLETALLTFEQAALNHSEATEQGDYKVCNKSYSTIIKAVAYLREQNHLQELLPFLNNSSEGVRVIAAANLLPINGKEAIATLEDIAQGIGIQSFNAKMVLREWRKGTLKL